MLRYEFLPSDFNPLFLFIGDSRDLAGLAEVLRRFARQPSKISMYQILSAFHPRTTVSLRPADLEFGMRPKQEEFSWYLNAWQAEQIAAKIERLADEAEKSGSEIFEIGSDGEIPVKVSRGEFTDDFLILRR